MGMTILSVVLVTKRNESKAKAIQAAAIEAGLTEPASLHPVINPTLCVGCGTCAKACPEGDVLGLRNNFV